MARLAELFPQGGTVGLDELVAAGAVRAGAPVKVLGDGDLGGVKLDITAHAFSGSARDKIEAAGGSATRSDSVRPPTRGRLLACPGLSACRAFPPRSAESDVGPAATTYRGRQQEDPCSGHSHRRSVRRTCARSSCSRSRCSILYRLGASVPTPNTDTQAINSCIKQASQGANANVYSLINLFSGGALLRLSVFALGIMPYITASIIIQLLVVVIPRFEQLKQEGQSGQQKLTQYSRYLTIGLAILQSTGFVALARSGQLFSQCTDPNTGQTTSILHHTDIYTLSTMVLTMTAGTARHHVAGRADHRPRRRQRHVGADVHLDRGAHPRPRARRSCRTPAASSSR